MQRRGLWLSLWICLVSMALASGLAACGSSSASPTEPAVASEPEMDAQKAAALQRLRARQAEVCEDFCVRTNDCVRQDAMENNPEILATKDGVTGEQLLAEHKRQCLDSCNNSGVMTPQQRKSLVEECFPVETCSEFSTCANRALSKP